MSEAAVCKFQAAMAKAYKEGLGADFTLLCEGETKKVHSAVLIARSPFFEAKIKGWEREMEIEDCDLVTLTIIVDYMYGINFPSWPDLNCQRLSELLKLSDKFQMIDMKAELEVLIIKTLTEDNLEELCNLGERLNCEMLIEACAELMVKKGCTMSLDDVKALPNVAFACIEAFGKKRKARKAKKAEETSDVEGEKDRKKARNPVFDGAVAATGRVRDIVGDIEDGMI